MSGTKDMNFLSFANQDGLRITDFDAPENPGEYDDLLKLSNCHDALISGITIPAGSREDSIDAVRGANLRIVDCNIQGSVTLKGGIDGWVLAGNRHGGTVEVGQFDNYWHPGQKPTRNGQVVHCAGKVRLILWDAEPPEVVNTSVQITKVPRVIWFPYFLFRYCVIRLKGVRTK